MELRGGTLTVFSRMFYFFHDTVKEVVEEFVCILVGCCIEHLVDLLELVDKSAG